MNFLTQLLSQQIAVGSYYSPSGVKRPGSLGIICAGRENCQPDYEVNRNTFPWEALELVVHGEGWLELHGAQFRLQPGTLFCYGPGIAYKMISDAKRPLQKYFVDFTGPEGLRSLKAGPIQPGQIRQALYPYELQELFERILVEGNSQAKHSSAIAVNYLRLLFQKMDECAEISPGRGSSRALGAYRRAREFLDDNYPELATIEAAATRLNTTPETLCRLFHRFAETSPYQYLTQLRIHASVNLLLTSDLLVKEVSAKVGFKDPFHFSRLFKRIQGLSPETFRRLRKRP